MTTSTEVIESGTNEVVKEFNKALGEVAKNERKQRFPSALTKEQQKNILDYQTIGGKSIGEWFDAWHRSDLEAITNGVQRACVEQMSVRDVSKLIRGTKENNYSDGILATSRISVVRLARTIINGVSNNARVETIKENQDVIDGVKFIGTLDGKTCPYCASLDGKIWRGEDMGQVRRPPIHPNCRCTLIPYIELKDSKGNIIEIDAERPAANADFDELAKNAYNENARQKGLKRRWDDLSSATKLKYYYQAQKDYERDNPGKKTYEQVSGSLTFAQYFKNQSEEFKRSWLGAKRYQLYIDGALDENKIFAPDLGYTVSTPVLFKVSKSESIVEENLENLIREQKERFKEDEFGLKIFGYLSNILSNFNRNTFSDSLEDNIKEYSKQELKARQREAKRLEESKKQFFKPKDFTSPTTIQEATTYAQKMFNIKADYSKARSLEVVNELNESLRSFFETYGDFGTLAKIELSDYLGLDIAQYSPDSMTLRVLNTSRDRIEKIIEKQNRKGHWNSKSIKDIIAHEGGHMIGEYLKQIDFDNHFIRMGCAVKMGERLENNGVLKLSEYSKYSPNEFLAEVVSAISANHFRKQYLNIFRIYFTDNVKEYYKGWIEVHGNS